MNLRAWLLLLAAALSLAASPPAAPEVIPLHTGQAYLFKSLAVDTHGQRIFLGSWDRKELVVVDLRAGTHRVIESRYRGRLNGMGVYLRGDRLYAVMNEVDDAPDARPVSALLVIDASSLLVLRSFELVGIGGRHHFNHVVVDPSGVAYVSDTLKSTIHTVDTTREGAALAPLVEHPDLSWVHGLDLSADGQRLFSTSYRGGIRIFDLRTRTFTAYRDPETAGDDGLKYHRGRLYGVGGGAIREYALDAAEQAVISTRVLLRDHALFNDPRDLHLEGDWLYCLANLRLGSLADSHVLKLELP
jgi:hypothetical protein